MIKFLSPIISDSDSSSRGEPGFYTLDHFILSNTSKVRGSLSTYFEAFVYRKSMKDDLLFL